jgi:hypothetical protein
MMFMVEYADKQKPPRWHMQVAYFTPAIEMRVSYIGGVTECLRLSKLGAIIAPPEGKPQRFDLGNSPFDNKKRVAWHMRVAYDFRAKSEQNSLFVKICIALKGTYLFSHFVPTRNKIPYQRITQHEYTKYRTSSPVSPGGF